MSATMDNIGFFEERDGGFAPTDLAIGQWSKDTLHGSAVCGLLAHQLERNLPAGGGFVPARLTVDLFAPVRKKLSQIETTVVRTSRRIMSCDAMFLQDGEVCARASMLALRTSQSPPGIIWGREHVPSPPPSNIAPDLHAPGLPFFGNDGHPEGWSTTMGEHQGPHRKRVWFPYMIDPLVSEEGSAFARAASIADGTSLITHWGDQGVGYINADVTIALSRLPVGIGLGIEADSQVDAAGVSVGSAVLFDEQGVVGTSVVLGLANAERQIDFSRHKSPAEKRR